VDRAAAVRCAELCRGRAWQWLRVPASSACHPRPRRAIVAQSARELGGAVCAFVGTRLRSSARMAHAQSQRMVQTRSPTLTPGIPTPPSCTSTSLPALASAMALAWTTPKRGWLAICTTSCSSSSRDTPSTRSCLSLPSGKAMLGIVSGGAPPLPRSGCCGRLHGPQFCIVRAIAAANSGAVSPPFPQRTPRSVAWLLYVPGGCADVPAVTHAIWQNNQQLPAGAIRIQLKGTAVGNGLTDPEIQCTSHCPVDQCTPRPY
jgi:hypothetical protein